MSQDPFGLKFVNPNPTKVIVLERVINADPDYCLHGRTRCMICREWCWLGTGTIKVVSDGTATPICQQCAVDAVQPGRIVGNVRDRRRSEGPHT